MKDIALDDLIKQDKEKQKTRHVGEFKRGNGRRLIKKNDKFNVRPRNDRFEWRRMGQESKNDNRQYTNRRIYNSDYFDKNRNQRLDREQLEPTRSHPIPTQFPSQQQQQQQEKGRTLKVLGLHPDITNKELYKLFSSVGALEKCLIEQDNFGRNLPTAVVKYYEKQTADKAIDNYNNQKVLNSVLKVEYYKYIRK